MRQNLTYKEGLSETKLSVRSKLITHSIVPGPKYEHSAQGHMAGLASLLPPASLGFCPPPEEHTDSEFTTFLHLSFL